jgi:23S rRNA (adenine2503-C2)-methyltransferase
MPKNLKNYTLKELRKIVEGYGQKAFHGKYIFNFIHQKNVLSIDEITPLSKKLRSDLNADGFFISHNKLIKTFEDPDGTVKFLIELSDESRIETVLLINEDKFTLCISSQTGCAMGCSFCATAKLGAGRNLSTAEIVDQVLMVRSAGYRITNVVYMGMGEPLVNYDNVVNSIRILNDSEAYNIGIRHITVSTCGIVPAIEKLAGEDVTPRLAISLNACNDKLRNELMPINRKYGLSVLVKSVNDYYRKTRRRVTIEYVLIDKKNDSAKDATELIGLIGKIRCNVNLIEYNPHPGCDYKPSSRGAIRVFNGILQEYGFETVVRFKRGQQIKAACGQLGADWLRKDDKGGNTK